MKRKDFTKIVFTNFADFIVKIIRTAFFPKNEPEESFTSLCNSRRRALFQFGNLYGQKMNALSRGDREAPGFVSLNTHLSVPIVMINNPQKA